MKEKEPDKLNIRKEAEQPLIFHSSREERLSRPGAPKPLPRGGFFHRNRALTITLVDVLILLIIGLGFRYFLSGTEYQARIEGYSVVLRGFHYEEVVFATLTVKKSTQNPETSAERIFVRFYLPDTGEEVYLSGGLPREPGEETVLREAVPAGGKADTLEAKVTIGGKTKRMRRKLER